MIGAAKVHPGRRQCFGEAVGGYTDCLAVLGPLSLTKGPIVLSLSKEAPSHNSQRT